MTLSDFAMFSTAISGLAVTGSLIYLAVQTHQNTKHTKALIQQGRSNAILAASVGFSDADKVTAYLKGNGGTASQEDVERRQFAMQFSAMAHTWLDAFSQYSEGLLSDDYLGIVRGNIAAQFGAPGIRDQWNNWKTTRLDSKSKFRRFIEEIAAGSVAPLGASSAR